MFGPGLLARGLGPDLQPARARKARHDALDGLDQERVAGEPRDLDVKVGADTVPLLAWHAGAAGVQHLLDRIEIGFGGAGAGEAYRGDLQGFAEFRQRLDFAEVDRRGDPVAAVTLHQALGLQPDQGGADRGAGAIEAGFQPALGQPLTGADIQRQDHVPQLAVDLEHL